MIGALITGIVERYQYHYKWIMFSSFVASALSFVMFTFAIHIANDATVVAISCFLMGFFVNFCMQGKLSILRSPQLLLVSLQVGIEVSFPISEGISANMLFLGLQFFGMVWIIILSAMEDPVTHSMTVATWLATVCVCLVAFASFFFKGKSEVMLNFKGELKRMKVDIGLRTIYSTVE